MFRQDERRPPSGSQFAVRVALLSGIALVAFGVIFFRLWYLEVLSGEAYLKEANSNRVREIKIQAPRGEILDANGNALVKNRSALSLQVRPDKMPGDRAARNKELRNLAEAAGMNIDEIKKEIRQQTAAFPASPVTLKRDVPQDLVLFLRERQDQFPGISAEEVYVRDYPQGTLAAHLLGYVSEVNEEQLKEPQYADLEAGDQIGATGLESQYDSSLRGRNGAVRVQVDALGQPRGQELSETEPRPGDNLVTTIDEDVQKAGEQALVDHATGLPGAAFVALDANDGAVLGMGSYPSFDPSIYTPPVSEKTLTALTNNPDQPLFNNADQSGYPTGSTFKLITATAALQEGLITPTETYNDQGSFEFGDREWINAGESVNGIIDMTDALRVSSDVYFYSLGIEAENAGDEPIQHWASQYGFGSLTGIDLPGEGAGLLPTPEWRNDLYDDANDPDSPCGRARDYVNCGETDRPWGAGDMMNLSVGQGDLQATPLQLAVAYATMANGGNVVRPHVGDRIEDPAGRTVQEITPAPRRDMGISAETRTTIMEGLREAAMEPGGTSYGCFGDYPIDIAGKTGTAERVGVEDQSWYAAMVPFNDPKYVVVVTIEQGGFGADAAAPAAKQIINTLPGLFDGKKVPSSSCDVSTGAD